MSIKGGSIMSITRHPVELKWRSPLGNGDLALALNEEVDVGVWPVIPLWEMVVDVAGHVEVLLGGPQQSQFWFPFWVPPL